MELSGDAANGWLRPLRREFVGVLFLIAGFFVLNLITYNYFPAVWCDEVAYSEPAINKILQGSYTTSVWEFNPVNTFPIVNCPLYGMTLLPWLALTGTSLVAVRSFNYMLMGLTAYLCWVISWRFRLVRTPLARFMTVGMLHVGYGMSFAYRSCRPDVLGLVCLVALVLVFGIKGQSLRQFWLGIFSAACVWIGLQIALFAGFMYVVIWIIYKRGNLRELICMAGGMATGVLSLMLFLYWQGVLSYFLPPIIGVVDKSYSVAPSASRLLIVTALLRRIAAEYLEDFSTAILIPALIVTALVYRRAINFSARKLVLCSLVMLFGTPILFEIFGHFAFYYSGLRFVPATLALFAVISDLTPGRKSLLRWCLMASAIGAMLVGLPLRLGITVACCKLAPRENLQRIIAMHISPNDVAFTDHATFFEVKQIASTVYDPDTSVGLLSAFVRGYDLTDEQRRLVSVLVIHPEHKERVCGYFGGDWAPVTGLFGDTQDFITLSRLPIVGKKFTNHASQPQIERSQVQMFRRVSQNAAKE